MENSADGLRGTSLPNYYTPFDHLAGAHKAIDQLLVPSSRRHFFESDTDDCLLNRYCHAAQYEAPCDLLQDLAAGVNEAM